MVNAPGNVSADIRRSRDALRDLARRPLRLEREARLEAIQRRDEEHHAKLLYEHDWLAEPFPECHPKYGEVAREYSVKEMQIRDPTTLILIDEADRLRMASLEQVRAIFDAGAIGLILIGMPGLEKRLARYPQFYSRIGFVHEFRPLGAAEIRQLLEQRWAPPGVHLPQQPLDQETVAAIIRITGGNFRLLNRLLTQMERILEINALPAVTKAVVEAARESLVIGAVRVEDATCSHEGILRQCEAQLARCGGVESPFDLKNEARTSRLHNSRRRCESHWRLKLEIPD